MENCFTYDFLCFFKTQEYGNQNCILIFATVLKVKETIHGKKNVFGELLLRSDNISNNFLLEVWLVKSTCYELV